MDHSIKLTSITLAKDYITKLVAEGMDFHFEDDPHEVITYGTGGERCFTDQEADEIEKRVEEMYALDWGKYECPIGFLLHVRGDD